MIVAIKTLLRFSLISILISLSQTNMFNKTYKAFFCNEKEKYARYIYWNCDETNKDLNFLLDNICVRFGNKVNRQVAGIEICTTEAYFNSRLVSVLLCYLYVGIGQGHAFLRVFMTSLQ